MRLFDTVGSDDAWLIELDGAEFLLHTAVSNTASDQNSSQVDFAQFAASGARSWIDGAEIEFLGGAQIDFAVSALAFDTVTAGGIFRRFGQVLEISSVVGLEPGTFSFISPSETPPHFRLRDGRHFG